MRNNLLVTGGAGFIGTNFVRYWQEEYPDDRIIVLDALTYAGKRNNLKNFIGCENFVFIHGSIGDQRLVDHVF